MRKIKEDLIELAIDGEFDLIIHGCNCFCTMGAGIAKTIKQKLPEAYKADLNTEKGNDSKLGTITFAESETYNGKLIVVNGYTQFNWRGTGKKVDYDAIQKVFRTVKEKFSGLRIGYPAIGAGLAGGDWNIISDIIDEELEGENHTFVEYGKLRQTFWMRTLIIYNHFYRYCFARKNYGINLCYNYIKSIIMDVNELNCLFSSIKWLPYITPTSFCKQNNKTLQR